jgi:signal transduction histidine kinase
MNKSSRLLVVDDDPGVLAVMCRAVETMGHQAVPAGSRAEARDRLRGSAFDVVISDIVMESSDSGIRLTEDASALRPGTPVILVSGQDDMESALPVLGAGACDYLQKPFLIGDLSSAVARALESRGAPSDELRDELAAAYVELQKVERMRESMQILVNHELRTPLFAAQLAAETISGPDGASPYAKEILQNNLKRLDNSITDILTHLQLSAGLPPPMMILVDLEALVRAQVETARAAAVKHGHPLTLEVSGRPRAVQADAESLSRAVAHLLSNAILFNRPSGAARVTLEFGASEAVLSVEDQGAGIPENEREKVFDAYYQVADLMTRSVGGLGLGLAIARGVFEGHGGGIGVWSGAEGGSVFRATLPLIAG